MTRFGRFTAGLVLLSSTAAAGVGALVLGGAPAGAATAITVTDAADGAGPFDCATPGGDCSLRAALVAANASAGDAVITLPDANTVANNPSSSHIYQVINSNGSLLLNDAGHTITINGAGQTLAILQVQNGPITNRVLTVDAGTTAVISGITAEDGAVTGAVPAGAGGGILNDGNLTLSDSTVTADTADEGGGIYLEGGSATLTNVAADDNTAGSTGGGIYFHSGTNGMSGGSADDNTSTGPGGGVYIEDVTSPTDSASLNNVDISSNTSSSTAGGLYVQNDNDSSNNPVTLTNATIDDNTASAEGGGLYVQNDGGSGGTFTMTGGSVSSNTSGESGGGIYDQNDGTSNTATFTGVAVDSNTSPTNAGGIYVQNDGVQTTTTFTGGSIDDNSASYSTASGQGGGLRAERRRPQHGHLHGRQHLEQLRLRGRRRLPTGGEPRQFHPGNRARQQRERGGRRVRPRHEPSLEYERHLVDHKRQLRRRGGRRVDRARRRWRDSLLLLQRHLAHERHHHGQHRRQRRRVLRHELCGVADSHDGLQVRHHHRQHSDRRRDGCGQHPEGRRLDADHGRHHRGQRLGLGGTGHQLRLHRSRLVHLHGLQPLR